MKKLVSLALALAMVLTLSLAFAKTVEPEDNDIEQFAASTVHATVGEYDAVLGSFTVTVYDYDRFDPEKTAGLAVGDTVLAGGYLCRITGVRTEDGTTFYACDDGEELYFEKASDGEDDLICRSTMDDRIYMRVVTVLHLPAAEGIVYEDNTDPEPDAKMITVEGLEAVLKAQADKIENSIGFDSYATTITLNENLEIVKIHQNFDVAQ